MEFVRHMFINYDEVDAVLEVEACENIGVFAMRFEGDEIEEHSGRSSTPGGSRDASSTSTHGRGSVWSGSSSGCSAIPSAV